ALMNVKAVPYVNEAVYFERKREDPILNPSLSQQSTTIRIPDFLYIYNELKSKYRNPTVNTFLDKQFLNFYRKNIVTYFKNGERIDSIFTYLSVAANHLQSKNLEKYDYFLKREL